MPLLPRATKWLQTFISRAMSRRMIINVGSAARVSDLIEFPYSFSNLSASSRSSHSSTLAPVQPVIPSSDISAEMSANSSRLETSKSLWMISTNVAARKSEDCRRYCIDDDRKSNNWIYR